MDVFIYLIPFGQQQISDFDEHVLLEAIKAANDVFRASSVIFSTIGFMNNIYNDERVELWFDTNHRIRNFTQAYNENLSNSNSNSNSTVEAVQFLDLGAFSENLIEINGKELGIPPNQTYKLRSGSRWKGLVAHQCASFPFPDDPKGCLPGMISVDGMHRCPETLHSRINAGLICLLDCKFNQNLLGHNLQKCSDECNSKYMGLATPIDFTESDVISLTS